MIRRECGWCGKRISVRDRTAFCSDLCRHRLHNWTQVYAKHGRTCASVLRWAACGQCGKTFSHAATRHPRFCRQRCRRNAAMRRRLHEIRSGQRQSDAFTLREIAERDGWRCHVCRRVVKDRPYTGKRSDPTIDHLIPLSRGGQHLRSNVALAHMGCNSEQGATGTVQLRLVG